MRFSRELTWAACLVACAIEATELTAQPVRAVPRPPAQAPGPPRAEDGSAAPDGYAPIPEWLGQTHASRAAKTAAYDVETVAEGLAGAFSFSFLPDGRIIVGERPGRIRIVGKDGKVSEPIDGMPANLFVRGGQGLYEVRPDRAFAANRTIYLTYTVLPDGSNPAALPRSPGVVVAARAKLSPDDKRLEDVKVLLNAEGTGGRLVQAPDGTLFITSSILTASMVADLAEDSEVTTGRRSEGVFVAANMFVQKSVSGIGIFGSSLLLGLVGFPRDAKPGAVDPAVIWRLGFVYVTLLVTVYAIAIACLSSYRISRESHEANLRRLASGGSR